MKDRTFEAALVVGAFALASCAALPGCAAAAPVAVVSQSVNEAAQLAVMALAEAKPFVDSYFAQHPDPVAQAKVLLVIKRANLAAQALASLAQGVLAVDEGQFLAALSDFRVAWADVLGAIASLPEAEVVTAPKMAMGVASGPKKMVFVAKPVSAFWPKAKRVAK